MVATAGKVHHNLEVGMKETVGMAVFEMSKPTTSDTLPPTRLYLPIFPKQFYPLGITYSNIGALEGILIQSTGPNNFFKGTFPNDLPTLPRPHL